MKGEFHDRSMTGGRALREHFMALRVEFGVNRLIHRWSMQQARR
jgi:hypothetical protein